MICVNCKDNLKMEYKKKSDGKFKGEYTCSCGLGKPEMSGVDDDNKLNEIKNSGEILFDYWGVYDRED